MSLGMRLRSYTYKRYFGSYIKGSQLWIVMEYCGGASCADMMKPDFIPEGYIAIILREVLLGLAYLHSEGKIHRDIKGGKFFRHD